MLDAGVLGVVIGVVCTGTLVCELGVVTVDTGPLAGLVFVPCVAVDAVTGIVLVGAAVEPVPGEDVAGVYGIPVRFTNDVQQMLLIA